MSTKNNDMAFASEFINHQLKTKGVSVITVSDGWVLTITKEKLLQLVEIVGDESAAMIHIVSSDGLEKN